MWRIWYGLKSVHLAVEREFVVADLVWKGGLVELHSHTAGIERIDRARLGGVAFHAIEEPIAIASEFEVGDGHILQFDARHVLVHAFEQVEKRMVFLLLVVFTVDLVQPPLDVRYFICDRIDGGIRPTIEIAHRLGGVYLLGSCWPVDR